MTIATFTLVLSLTGVSMSLWNITYTQGDNNTIIAGCFSLVFEDENSITLSNTYPMSDVKGKKTSPYTFTLKNTCSLTAEYYITLDIVDSTTTMDLSKVMVSLEGSKKLNPTIISTLRENADISDPTDIRNSYIVRKDSLNPAEIKSYDLRLWVDEVAGNTLMNKTLEARVTITAVATIDLPVLMAVSEGELLGERGALLGSDVLGFAVDIYHIENIVFTNTNKVPIDADGSWDVSEAQDGSVMAWYKERIDAYEQAWYDVWIGGSGGVAANPDSSFLFSELYRIQSIDFTYFDTSLVTNMSSMFFRVGVQNEKWTLIGIQNWDVTSATNMNCMFCATYTLTELHLDNWDLPTATNTDMFTDSNNEPYPDNLQIYVKDSAMKSWINAVKPSNAEVFIAP